MQRPKYIIGLLAFRYGIPLLISIFFAIDVFIFNSFIYFPRVAILYSIPLLIRIIIYMLKMTSIVEYPKFYKDFDIKMEGLNITHFSIKQDKQTVICLDENGQPIIYTTNSSLIQQAHDYFCLMHYVWYRSTFVLEELFIKSIFHYPILICQFFTSWIFLCSWIKLTYFALISYFNYI